MDRNYQQAIERAAYLVDNWLPMKILYDEIPGLSVGIVYKGKLVYKRGFGYANRDSKKKTTPQTLYRVASISKMFTAIAILQLVEQGKVRLDDPVSKYVSWFKGKNKAGDFGEITIRHILSHNSGLFRDGMTPHWSNGVFPKSLKTTAQQAIIKETLESYKYSNYAFSLLGEVVKKASGIPYESYVQKHIITELGLKNTFPDLPPSQKQTQLAAGYSRRMPGREQASYDNFSTNAFVPATGFTSNVSDLGKFISSLSLVGNRKTLLSRSMQKEMMRPHHNLDKNEMYGLGLGIYTNIAGRKAIGHTGGFLGYASDITFLPKEDIGVVVLINKEGANAPGIGVGILELVYHFLENEKSYTGKKVAHARYEGLYRDRFGDAFVAGIGSKLLLIPLSVTKPLNTLYELTPSKQKDTFLAKSIRDDEDDHNGEIVHFSDIKNQNAHALTFGGMRAERLTEDLLNELK